MEKEKAVDRLFEYFDVKGLKPTPLERDLHVSNGYFLKQKKNKGSLGSDIIEKIAEHFSDLNTSWLITGKGKMFLEPVNKTTGYNTPISEVGFASDIKPVYGKSLGIPLIPISAVAGSGNGDFQVHENDILQRFFVPGFEKADFLIPIKGDSMTPKYYSGDIIACMRVQKGPFIEWNKAYVLDTTIGVLVKRILKSNESGNWILRSENKEYQDIEVNPDTDIRHISKIIGMVRME